MHFKDLDIPYRKPWHNGIGTTSCSVCLINLNRSEEVGSFPANAKKCFQFFRRARIC